MKPAFVFDLDGVVIDTESHWKAVSHEFLRNLVPAWGEDDQKKIFGLSARGVFDRLNEVYAANLEWENYLKEYQGLAAEIYGNRAEPVPGALEFLAFLDQSQFQLALATSAPRQWVDVVLERFFLASRFQSVITADDVGKNTKPSPEPYLLASQGLGRAGAECIAFEDSPKGIESSRGAGLRCVALLRTHNQRHDLSAANLVINSFEEIPIRNLESWLKTIPY